MSRRLHQGLRAAAAGSFRLLVLLSLAGAVIVPPVLLAAPPAWWMQRGLTAPGVPANDYAVINQGQLKNMAKRAMQEMDADLPGGAGSIVHALVDPWAAATDPNDFAAMNLGQLKAVSKPFYDRLIAVGYASAYPWTGSSTPANNYAMANIGQAKFLFSFNLVTATATNDTNNDGMADWWEQYYFHTLNVSPSADPDGDSLTNLQEFQQGKNPTDYYNNIFTLISIASGNDQTAAPGTFTAYPLVVSVTDGTTNAAKANAPITFTTTSGQLAASPNGSGSSSLQVRADSNGMAAVYLKMPSAGVFTQVTSAADNCPPVVFNEGLAQLLPTPTSISLSVDQGEVQERTLTLVNTSSQTISYSVSPSSVNAAGVTPEAPQDPANPQYNWLDSDTAGGPAYVWNDISTTGTVLTNISPADDADQQVNLPFNFPFFGNSYSAVFVCSNGFLNFGTGSTAWQPIGLPSASAPLNMIAPFWEDLVTYSPGNVYYLAGTNNLTIQFNKVAAYGDSSGNTYTFQVVLDSSGKITFYYNTMSGTVNNATVGIQDGSNPPYTRQVAYNQAYIHNGLAVQFHPLLAPWLQLNNYTGTVAAYDGASVDMTFSTAGLGAGIYTAILHLKDSQGNTVGPGVPVNWTVSGTQVVDSDGNGLPDKWEMQYFGHLGVDPNADPDHDGLSNLMEYRLGSNPLVADTNGDGIIDGVAYRLGISVTNTDMNANGVSNAVERQQGTDPLTFNIPNSQRTVTTLNDNTPLTIKLLEPSNATLLP